MKLVGNGKNKVWRWDMEIKKFVRLKFQCCAWVVICGKGCGWCGEMIESVICGDASCKQIYGKVICIIINNLYKRLVI